MTDKKYSVTLSAKENLSATFESAGSASARFRKEIDETNKQLKQLGDTSKRSADLGALRKEMDGTKGALAGAKEEAGKAATAIKNLTEQQKGYKKELQAAERQLEKMKGFVGPTTPAQQEAIAATTRKIAELKAAYAGAGKEIKEAEKAQKSATGEAKRLTDTLGSQGRRLGSLTNDLNKAGVNTKALGAEQLRLKRDTDLATAAMERQQKRLATISDAQAKMAANRQTRADIPGELFGLAAASAPAIYAAKKAVDYESAFAGVTKVVTFKDDAEKAATRSRMMEMAGQLGVDQVGMTNIVAAAGEAGIGKRADGTTDANELLRFAGDASKMSVAMDMTAEEAGTTLAKWRSAMGMDQDQAMRLADYSNAISNEMAAKPAEVARVMLRQGATTMKAGFTDRQAAALAASLIAGGEGEETTATAMKNITGRLNKSFAATKAQKETLAMLGFDPMVLAKDMQRDAGGTLFKVLGKIGTQDKDKQAAVISQLFGEEVVGAVSKLTANTDLLRKAMNLAGDEAAYAGSMEAEYQNKAKTRQAMLERAGANFDRLIINLGDLFLPLMDEVVEPLSAMAASGAKLMETSEAARETAGWLVKAGAALIGLKAGIIVFKGVKSIFSDMFQAGRIMKAKLGGATDKTASSANRAAAGLARVNRQLDMMGGAGGPSGARGRAGRGGKSRSRLGKLREAEDRIAGAGRSRGRFGRFGKGAGLLGLGAGLMMMPKGAEASEMVKEVADVGGGAAEVLAGAGKTAGHVAGKVIRPLGMISAGSELYGAAMTGNTAVIGGATGDILGGAAGGWAGAAAGAAVGSVVPVIGTAVGAAVGGALGAWGGGELGNIIGEQIGKWFATDKTALANGADPVKEVIKQETKKTEISNKFDLRFDVRASGDPEQDNALVEKIKAQLSSFLPSLLTSSLSLDTRTDASLAGLGSD
ncbi:phage tail tape measure protein [Aeromonas sp. ARM81]|uniref:phage tail tape measure protein n=1 Tax=Aeromonas sp. ARM81 TaxID=1747384 RepID=UPI00090C419B|nr:phage tail tape measure protein [Aeromonas sp. ARM81]ALN97542.1 tail tape measure protein [Aeromonas phage phiARM81ld]RDD48690.1 phage tail tape measure protein [Aeromonas sp. ARM81]